MPASGIELINITAPNAAPFSAGVLSSLSDFNGVTTQVNGSGTARIYRNQSTNNGAAGSYGKSNIFDPIDFSNGRLLVYWLSLSSLSLLRSPNFMSVAVGSGTANWKRWVVATSTTPTIYQGANWVPILIDPAQPADASAGTLVTSAIDRVELSFQIDAATSYTVSSGRLYTYDVAWTGGTAAAPGSAEDIRAYIASIWTTNINPNTPPVTLLDDGIIRFRNRIRVGDGTTPTFFTERTKTILFSDPTADPFSKTAINPRKGINIRGLGGGAVLFDACTLQSSVDWEINLATEAATFSSCIINRCAVVSTVGRPLFDECQLVSPRQITATNLNLVGSSIKTPTQTPALVAAAADAPFVNDINITGANVASRISFTPGQDLSVMQITYSQNTRDVELNPLSAGVATTNFTGLRRASQLRLDNITNRNISVKVATAQTTLVQTPTTGGGSVAVVADAIALTAPNLPDGTHYLIRYRDGDLAELAIGYVTGGSGLVYNLPPANNNRLVELLAIHVTSTPLYASELFRFTFRNNGSPVSAEGSLTAYPFYGRFGVDGLSAAITSKFTFDNPSLQVDATEVDGFLTAKEPHAFLFGQLQTNDNALRLGYLPIQAFTDVGYVVRNNWKVENQSTITPLLITEGYYVDEAGQPYNPCAPALGGKQSTSIFFEPSHTLTVNVTGGSGGTGSTDLTPVLNAIASVNTVLGNKIDTVGTAVGAVATNVISINSRLPATPAAKADVQVTVAPTAVTVNPTPVTVSPTPLTVNPTPVTVEGGFTAEAKAALDAINSRLPNQPAAVSDIQVTVTPPAVTVNPTAVTVNPTPVVVQGGFTSENAALLASIKSDSTIARAGVVGEQVVNEANKTATLYDGQGNVVVVFDLKDQFGQPAVERVYRRVPRA
ncbi:hypothetical protein [Pseudanabaena sp. FACHB-2040]|uniref:hypothetical protein n=1 Tax=Pseudanabaena sp. FACHB-2040 TaxID=2692859 RepID=UPI001689660F|nr:hypothetical protein [Pseudanabaena sp. FACHB-2040]MBD2256664.1 hypothetical protein [Pseudanabaena sp. FACHB-2040]